MFQRQFVFFSQQTANVLSVIVTESKTHVYFSLMTLILKSHFHPAVAVFISHFHYKRPPDLLGNARCTPFFHPRHPKKNRESFSLTQSSEGSLWVETNEEQLKEAIIIPYSQMVGSSFTHTVPMWPLNAFQFNLRGFRPDLQPKKRQWLPLRGGFCIRRTSLPLLKTVWLFYTNII